MPRNIVVCYDGTGNEYGDTNTNVVRAFEAIERDGQQIAFYDPGVGTFSYLGRTAGRHVGPLLGKAFGLGLVENIEDGYEYLMNTHVPGDKVFILGFSRGAFQARVLADYIYKMGVLQKGSKNLIPYATKLYFTRDNKDICDGFKATYCHPCETHFVGVWDTVASLGYFFAKKFSNSILNPDVKFAYQAAAIDEKRKKFPVSLWDEDKRPETQTMEQVWFAGVHSDVGGGYRERGLSNITLAWLMEKAEGAGLRLRPGWRDGVPGYPMETIHESRTGFWKLWREAPRRIPEGALIHPSVRERMDAGRYKPNFPKDFRWTDLPEDGRDEPA